jgi:site-specific recombinase XerD
MNNVNLIGPWVRRFLMENLIQERNLTRNTQESYRDMLILLLPFTGNKIKKQVDKLTIEDFTPTVIRSFLLYLEDERKCTVSTRNQRLAAIHALARFIGRRNPQYLDWCTEICAIPLKKTPKVLMCYLEKPEMDALLDAPDRNSKQGFRDYALMLFLYNTGARADETAQVTIADLTLNVTPAAVRIVGKGGKIRRCPLWSLTSSVLCSLVRSRPSNEKVFLNRCKQPMTRFGIYAFIKRYVHKTSCKVPSLRKKQVSPHTVRHTTAVHLLRAGVDINTIRAWLGHVSLDTTHIYAEVDLELKAKALAHCEILTPVETKKQWHDRELMAFLRTL